MTARPRFLVLLPFALIAAASVNACGDDAAKTGGNPSGVTGGGAAGSAGSATAGSAGKATGGASAGEAGKSGASTAGTGGTSSGAGGVGAGCTKDEECVGSLVPTKPEGCAEAYCNAGKCALRSKDADGDGFRLSKCQAVTDKPIEVEVGKDCDDTKKDVNPAAWDGPAGEGNPDACNDGVDQNCSGADGDDLLANGTSCACTPGDTSACSETAAGVPIVFPGGAPAAGSICVRGSKTCDVDPVAGGKWGPCVNARGPGVEVCNGTDDDCDGQTDEDDATDRSDWYYDGDGDGQGALVPGTGAPFASLKACATKPPSAYPAECTDAYCAGIAKDACCPKDGWRLNIPKLDCDDRHASAFVGGIETCGNEIDENCDGKTNEAGAVGEKDWAYDADGDGTGDEAKGLVRSCGAPCTLPAHAGTDCAKWKPSIPATDCNDADAAISPKATEKCDTPTIDENCNGNLFDQCPCQEGTSQPLDCGAPGDCAFVAKGSTCIDGKYTPCPAPVAKVEFCPDLDGDGYCSTSEGSCAQYCPTGDPAQLPPPKFVQRATCTNASGVSDCKDDDATVNPVATELCGDGKDSNCKTLAGNNDSDGYALGDVCSVVAPKGSAGVCFNGGKKICASVGATTTTCKANDTGAGSSLPKDKPGTNNSWDWDCDGKTSITRRECRAIALPGGACGCSSYTFESDQVVTSQTQWTTTNLLMVNDPVVCTSLVGQTACEKRGPLHFFALCGPRGCADPDCASDIRGISCVWNPTTLKCGASKVAPCTPPKGTAPSGNSCN